MVKFQQNLGFEFYKDVDQFTIINIIECANLAKKRSWKQKNGFDG